MRKTRRRLLFVAIALAAIAGIAALAFGPIVRREIAKEADRRDLDVEVGTVRPAWGAVRLLDVKVRPRGTTRVSARLEEVRVDVGRESRKVSVHGGHVEVSGTAAEVRDELAAWRARRPAGSPGATAKSAFEIDGVSARWDMGEDGIAEGSGVRAGRDGESVWVHAERLHAAHHGATVDATGARVALDGHLAFSHAHADGAEITLATTPPADETDAPAAAPRIAPFDLRAVRAKIAKVAATIASRLPEGAAIDVDALVVHAAVDVGPAALHLARGDGRIEGSLSSRERGDGAGPRIDLHATLPIEEGDARVTFDGGPLSLATLGIKDHTFGLTDLDRATIAGHADLVLPEDADALSFDVDLRVRALAVDQRRLSTGVVHGLDVDVRGRGRLAEDGALAVDDAELALGGARVELAGKAALGASPSLDVRWSVPRSSCKEMIENLPEGLAPTIRGTRWDGDFDAHGRFAFDLRRLDAMVFDYEIRDECKVVSVPERLSLEHFKQPFAHTVYDPEGHPREETTGPGTPRWTPLASMSRYLPIAVIMTEDGGFYRKEGFNHPQIRLAVETDLKERRFARGASTLLMQLAKNLFLARDKTMARKLEQVLLTEILSQTYPKSDVLELYLNIVELGPDIYGVRDGAAHYFGKGPWGLNLGESLMLAAMLPSPVKLHGLKGLGEAPPLYVDSIHHLMDLAEQSGLITKDELEDAKAQPIRFAGWAAAAPKASQATTTASVGGTAAKRENRVD